MKRGLYFSFPFLILHIPGVAGSLIEPDPAPGGIEWKKRRGISIETENK
jgi:hypothetical protein